MGGAGLGRVGGLGLGLYGICQGDGPLGIRLSPSSVPGLLIPGIFHGPFQPGCGPLHGPFGFQGPGDLGPPNGRELIGEGKRGGGIGLGRAGGGIGRGAGLVGSGGRAGSACGARCGGTGSGLDV